MKRLAALLLLRPLTTGLGTAVVTSVLRPFGAWITGVPSSDFPSATKILTENIYENLLRPSDPSKPRLVRQCGADSSPAFSEPSIIDH